MHEKHLTRRLLALIVALALSASFVVPVSAASWNDFGRSGSSGSSSGKSGFHWGGFDWSGFPWGGWGSSGEDDESETTPSTDPGASSEGDSTLNLVENDTTVEEGTELVPGRAYPVDLAHVNAAATGLGCGHADHADKQQQDGNP